MGWITLLLIAGLILVLLTEPIRVDLDNGENRFRVTINFIFLCVTILPSDFKKKKRKKRKETQKSKNKSTATLYLKALLRMRHRVRFEIDTLELGLFPVSPLISAPIGSIIQGLLLPFSKDGTADRIRPFASEGTLRFQISFYAKLYDVINYFRMVNQEKRRRKKECT